MRKFKRSTHSIVAFIFLALLFFYAIRIFIVGYVEGTLLEDTLTPTDINILLRCCFCFVAGIIAIFTLPPDFNYLINVTNDCIIFEMAEEDHRRIDKNFTIISKGKHYIVMDDGFSRICIAYNKEVLQFLNEINN